MTYLAVLGYIVITALALLVVACVGVVVVQAIRYLRGDL